MESRAFAVSSSKNPSIEVKVIPGHFATSASHLSRYLDMSGLKSDASVAKDVAKELAVPYRVNNIVDTIVCIEETEVVGAYLAEELLQAGTLVMNSGRSIRVITPMSNRNGQLVFHSSTQEMIYNKHIILLVASISSGMSVRGALECLAYYGGKLTGISSLFSNMAEIAGNTVHSIFTRDDIPDYQIFIPSECALCKEGRKLDAIVSSEGYTKIS